MSLYIVRNGKRRIVIVPEDKVSTAIKVLKALGVTIICEVSNDN